MRFDLRLHGRTSNGQSCVADVSVYAKSAEALQREAHEAATNAPWHTDDEKAEWIADKETITVENVELIQKPRSGSTVDSRKSHQK